MKSTQSIDATKLLADVDAVRKARGLTWNGVFHQTYITNLSQVRRGIRSLTVDSAQTLASWAGLNLASYTKARPAA